MDSMNSASAPDSHMPEKAPSAANPQEIIDLISIILSGLDDQDSDNSFLISMGSLRPEEITESDHENTATIRNLLAPLLEGRASPLSANSVDDLNEVVDIFGDLVLGGWVNGIPAKKRNKLVDCLVDHVCTVCIGLEEVSEDAKNAAQAGKALLERLTESKTEAKPKSARKNPPKKNKG